MLVVGLGNPGDRYRGTRHNVGFDVVDRLVRHWGANVEAFDASAELWRVERAGDDDRPRTVWLMKPLTYMNRSGQAVAAWAETVGVDPEALVASDAHRPLVIVDDMALPVGRLRFRSRGRDGGHNGLASIADTVGTEAYDRLRIGVGPPPPVERWVEFVLAGFDDDERDRLSDVFDAAVRGIDSLLRHGMSRTMSEFNRVDLTGDDDAAASPDDGGDTREG